MKSRGDDSQQRVYDRKCLTNPIAGALQIHQHRPNLKGKNRAQVQTLCLDPFTQEDPNIKQYAEKGVGQIT
jgi:hypothetical protein